MQSISVKRVLPVIVVVTGACLLAAGRSFGLGEEATPVELQHINPNPTFGLSEAVAAVTPGVKFIFLSGQVGFGPEGVPKDLGEQAEIAFAGVVKQLEAAGATTADVVKINTYIKDLDLGKAQIVGQAKNKYFTAEDQPASTWIGVTGLVLPNLLVEVEAIAVVAD